MGDAVTVLVKIRRSLGKIRLERIRISKRKARRTPAVSRFQPVGWLRAIAAGIPFGKAFHVSSVRFSAGRHHRIAPARRRASQAPHPLAFARPISAPLVFMRNRSHRDDIFRNSEVGTFTLVSGAGNSEDDFAGDGTLGSFTFRDLAAELPSSPPPGT